MRDYEKHDRFLKVIKTYKIVFFMKSETILKPILSRLRLKVALGSFQFMPAEYGGYFCLIENVFLSSSLKIIQN